MISSSDDFGILTAEDQFADILGGEEFVRESQFDGACCVKGLDGLRRDLEIQAAEGIL